MPKKPRSPGRPRAARSAAEEKKQTERTRQSTSMSNVSDSPSEEEQGQPSAMAAHVGARVRDALDRLGWVQDGKYDVSRLVAEVAAVTPKPPRWQTAQGWIQGTSVPSPSYAPAVARVLDMTLDELLGVAAGQDPPFEAWHAFLGTEQGRTMTASERRSLQAIPWQEGTEPTVASYQVMLAGLRTSVPRR